MNFEFDISEVSAQFFFTKEEEDALASYVIDRVVTEYQTNLEKLVKSELHSTANEYISGIYTKRPDNHTAIIGISKRSSSLGFMIEAGSNVIDLKEGFKKSEKAHNKGTNDWWLTIPIQHATSDAVVGSIIGANIPKPVLTASKKAEGKPLGISDLPAPFNETKTKSLQLNTGVMITYTHKSPIYEGLERIEQQSKDKPRGGYFTFRRVSENSDESSWNHPGFEAKDFIERAWNDSDILEVIANAKDTFLKMKLD